eukprot:4429148-Alexandrium_andersonii.AAC.1
MRFFGFVALLVLKEAALRFPVFLALPVFLRMAVLRTSLVCWRLFTGGGGSSRSEATTPTNASPRHIESRACLVELKMCQDAHARACM